MYSTLTKLFKILSPSERRQLFYVLFLMTIMGGLELIGISLIFPFMSVLSDPGIIQTNKYLSLLYNGFSFTSQFNFIVFIGVSIVLVTVVSSLLNIFTNYKIFRFTEVSSSTMSTGLLNEYLAKPYPFFLTRNPNELKKNVLGEVNQITTGVILPFLQGISRVILLIILFTFTLWFNFFVSLMVIGVFGTSYVVIYILIRKKLGEAGKARVTANKNKHHVVSKVFGGIKEIKLLNNFDLYVEDFKKSFNEYAKCQVEQQIYGIAPRYLLEIVAFGGIVIFTLVLYTRSGNFQTLMPTLSFFALVGYKSLPALQNVYNSVTKIKFHLPAVDLVYKDMTGLKSKLSTASSPDTGWAPISLTSEVSISNVFFKYESAQRNALKDLNLTIKAHTIVGFVGPTGAGKTTVVDILLGLLPPDQGFVSLDDVRITPDNIKSWHRMVGYVPQRIYLSDDTVMKNIAFGEDDSTIDVKKVHEAARLAQIDEFIMEDLQEGYETKIGDRGVRLSGGQSQRIGIARALYRNPSVLILDEATSALDNITESSLIETIRSLNSRCTIIMIAHRLSTVEKCDKIFYLEKGQLIGEGTFNELLQNIPAFKDMAGHT